MVHNTCNPDTTLAPETPEWRWLADVTPKYVFRRARTLWMKKHRQEDRWGKAQEGQGKRRDGSSSTNGNSTIAIRAAKCGSSNPRGATGVQ